MSGCPRRRGAAARGRPGHGKIDLKSVESVIKRIDDGYGRRLGDEVIRAVTDRLARGWHVATSPHAVTAT